MKKRKKSNCRKRTTFAKIFAKSAIIATAVTLVFSIVVYEIGIIYLDSLVMNTIIECSVGLTSKISSLDNDDEKNLKQKQAVLDMSFSTASFTLTPLDLYFCEINSGFDEGFSVSLALFDPDGNIVATSEQKLMAGIKFSEEDERNGLYICDKNKLNHPEVQQIYSALYEIAEDVAGNSDWYYEIEIYSAYVDTENYLFIPKSGKIDLYCLEYAGNTELQSTVELHVDIDDDSFEVLEFETDYEEYPRITLESFWGTSPQIFEQQLSQMNPYYIEFYEEGGSGYTGFSRKGSVQARYELEQSVYFGGEELIMCIMFDVDYTTGKIRTLYYILVSIFFAVAMLIALINSIRRNALNKASYAFEDYQKTLINNLAHDIKTPLTAIGGYAENLIEMRKNNDDEKVDEYLTSIMENVAYTDSIVCRTLELNHISEITKVSKTKTDISTLLSEIVSKYRLLLEDKNIDINIQGDATIDADAHLLETAIENLVTNAVKYSPECTIINVDINEKYFEITNEVSEKIDVTDITMPFVKGDKSRSGKLGSGLGLSIAKSAVERNGFVLKVACTDDIFTAQILF